MLSKIKKYLFLIVIAFLIITIFPKQNYANEFDSSLRLRILSMSKPQLFNKLKEDGLILPSFFDEHQDIAEDFVYEFTPMLLSGRADASVCTFGNWQTYEMLVNLDRTLRMQGLLGESPLKSMRYVLKNSSPIGSWIQSYTQYNCYAYSIGRTSWRQPNGKSGNYDTTKPISKIADDVLLDLKSLGYWGYKTTTKPTKLPDKFFSVICVSKDTDNKDYHFMKMYGNSLNSWSHKPGQTQPLKWKYS